MRVAKPAGPSTSVRADYAEIVAHQYPLASGVVHEAKIAWSPLSKRQREAGVRVMSLGTSSEGRPMTSLTSVSGAHVQMDRSNGLRFAPQAARAVDFDLEVNNIDRAVSVQIVNGLR